MEKSLKRTAELLLLLLVAACGGSKKPEAYNNELMVIINDNDKYISEMNKAMIAADYEKASEVREVWEADLKKQIEQVEKIGDFNGDDILQRGILSGLKAYEKIVKEDYVKLIDIRSSGTKDPTAETEALNNINDAFEKAAGSVNKAGSEFERKYAQD
ncbi:LIC11966 family surface protein [Olivibacter sitiensis]|uniref:LIC11966 family surface protein n=1 Tax=Olivibacter sitiensis TaxID=376470 RepID=UPI000429439C|nr:hypothetical protein [Olivibacter sitiensis]